MGELIMEPLKDVKRTHGAAALWIHFLWLRRRIEIVRINHERMVLLFPSRENPNSEVVDSVLDVPTRRQIIERKFLFQDIPDGDDALIGVRMDWWLVSQNSSGI
jgi:hypothetical protein